MAYKNRKKNKIHQAKIRKANAHKKRERERRRNQKNVSVMTEEDCLRLMKIHGLIDEKEVERNYQTK